MKLEPRVNQPRRDRAVEVLNTPEQVVESDFFDPRVDVSQADWGRYLAIISEPTEDYEQRRRKYAMAWVGWVHPEYLERLRTITGFQEFWISHFEKNLRDSRAHGWKKDSNAVEAARLFQAFPEARQRIQFSWDEFGDMLTFATGPSVDIFENAVAFIQIWPKKRHRIIQRLFGSEQAAFQTIQARLKLGTDGWHEIKDVSNFLLLFPQYRSEVLTLLGPWKKEILNRAKRQPTGDIIEFEDAQQRLKQLTVLGAADASIDEAGQIQVKLPPLSQSLSSKQPLPPRPEV